jgi:hypothetical protein
MAKNPLKTDSKLRTLLADVDSIKSDAALMTWRQSFLKVYESYLDPDGVSNARDADGRLIKKLQTLATISLKVQKLSRNGNICEKQVTAEGRRALGNWTAEMQRVEEAVGAFCPKTSAYEEKVGYDKFELGAVLIKDGFHPYEIMLTSRDFITELRDGPLKGTILDKNALSIMDFYVRGIQSFVDIMADLGLMKLMTKCVKIYEDAPRPDPKDEPGLFEEPNDENGEEGFPNRGKGPDGTSGDTTTQTRGKKKKGKSTIDFSGGKKPNTGDDDEFEPKGPEEDVDMDPPPAEGDGGDAVKLIHFDPKTGEIGILMRDKCVAESELIVGKDDEGEEINCGVIEDDKEKQKILLLLKKLEKQKPAPPSWLDEIKKEKATKKTDEEGDEDVKNGGNRATAKKPVKSGANSPRSEKQTVRQGNTSPKIQAKKPVKAASEKPSKGSRESGPLKDKNGWGTKSPFDMSGSSGSGKKKAASSPKTSPNTGAKKPVKAVSEKPSKGSRGASPSEQNPPIKKKSQEDHQGNSKKVAPNPGSAGWAKVGGVPKKNG